MKTAVERLQAKLWENNFLTSDDLKLFKEAKEMENEQKIRAQVEILRNVQESLDGNKTEENNIWHKINRLKQSLISQLPSIDSDGGVNGAMGKSGPTGIKACNPISPRVQISDEKAEQGELKQRVTTLEQKVEQLSQPKKFAQGSTFDRQYEIKKIVEEWKKSTYDFRAEKHEKIMEEWKKSDKAFVPVGLNFEFIGGDMRNSSEQEKSSSERDFIEFDPKDYSFEKELAALDEMHKNIMVDFACEAFDITYRSDDSFRKVATELYDKIYNSKTNTKHQ
jgi:hypothetical protein